MRVFCGAIFTESNTFSPIPTSLESFRAGILYRGPAAGAPPLVVLGSPWLAWRELCAARGFEFQQGLIAFAEPAGVLSAHAHEELRGQLLADLEAALPVDIVLLALHGSMMSEACDDVEGDVLEKARACVGTGSVVAALIDPHAHLSARMVVNADVIAAFHEWPHTDVEERAAHVFELAVRTAAGEVRPTPGTYDCRMIAAYPTQPEPMRGFVDGLKRLEACQEVLSASFVHGFPWGDNPDVGARMLVWTDADSPGARARASALGRRIFDLREAVTLRTDFSIDDALTHLQRAPRGPVVLCDAGDNVPGGAAGDSTFLLRRVLERAVGDVCFGPIWDPMATAICFAAGEGARVALRIGGKSGPAAGDPVDVVAHVVRVLPGVEGPQPGNFGDRAWITIGDSIDIVLHSRRATLASPDVITALGIDVKRRKGFIGKMLMHGGAAFAPLAAEVRSVATPGTLNMCFESIALRRRSEPWWPKHPNPFGAT